MNNSMTATDWILWRALRIAVVCTMVQWAIKETHILLGHWILITLVIIANIDVGSSFSKMFDRVVGVTAGCSLGFILGTTLIQFHYDFVYLAVLWVFIGWYTLIFRYQIAFFFMMLMLTSLFYILSPAGHSAREILTYRVVNIYIGVLIGFVIELVFPINRANTKLTITLQQHWKELAEFIQTLSKPGSSLLTNHGDFDRHCQQLSSNCFHYVDSISLSNFERVLFHADSKRIKNMTDIHLQFIMQLSNLHHLLSSATLTQDDKNTVRRRMKLLSKAMQSNEIYVTRPQRLQSKATMDVLNSLFNLVAKWQAITRSSRVVTSHSRPSVSDNASPPHMKKQ